MCISASLSNQFHFEFILSLPFSIHFGHSMDSLNQQRAIKSILTTAKIPIAKYILNIIDLEATINTEHCTQAERLMN